MAQLKDVTAQAAATVSSWVLSSAQEILDTAKISVSLSVPQPCGVQSHWRSVSRMYSQNYSCGGYGLLVSLRDPV
ncbi:hypothetical protein ACNKHL_26390 [Shigella flexneri]